MIRLENVLKISLQDVLKTSWRCLEDVFQDVLKMFWRRLEDISQDVLKMCWRYLEDVFKTSWRRLEDVLKTSWKRLEDVLKTSSEDVRLRRTYSSWSRRLEDVFWRQRRKTSSRRFHQDECLLGCMFWRNFGGSASLYFSICKSHLFFFFNFRTSIFA